MNLSSGQIWKIAIINDQIKVALPKRAKFLKEYIKTIESLARNRNENIKQGRDREFRQNNQGPYSSYGSRKDC